MKRTLFRKPFVHFLVLLLFIGILPIGALALDGDDDPAVGLLDLSFGEDDYGRPGFSMTPEFNNETTDYTVTMPDYASKLYCYAKAVNDTDKIYAYQEFNDTYARSSVPSESWKKLSGLTEGTDGIEYIYHIGAAPNIDNTDDAVYHVTVQRAVTLEALTVNDTLCPSFEKDTLNYTAGVAEDATTVNITATGYASDYTLTIDGAAATSGEAATVNLDWDGNGKMTVPIVVSYDGAVSTTYTLTLIRETEVDTPVISMQPQGATYLDTVTEVTPLKVRASANGTLSYQWYSNTTDSNDGGDKIDGATADTYTPVVDNVDTTAQTTYYYCIVTNTNGESDTFTAKSSTAKVMVKPDPTPVASIVTSDGNDVPAEGYAYNSGETNVTTLKVNMSTRADGGTWTYQWRSTTGSVPGTTDQQSFTPETNRDMSYTLKCVVTYTVDGVAYTVDSANTVPVQITAVSAQAPVITTQPVSQDYQVGAPYVFPLTVAASRTDGGAITYQWYSSSDNESFTAIADSTTNKYEPPISDTPVTTYYYCKITNTVESSNGNTYTTTANTDTAIICFKTIDDLGGDWTGEGTENAPYLIQNIADLTLLRDLVNSGINFEGTYFELTADIDLPGDWVPIGGLKPGASNGGNGANILPFSATLDGDNHTVTVAEDGKCLFGYVRHAYIKNLNIYGKQIAGYGLVEHYDVDYGPTAKYSDYTALGYPLTVEIDHVTLKSGTKTQKAGFIGGFGSGSNMVNIYDCIAESDVIIGYDKDQSGIGSFAGSFNGSIANCVSYATVYGVNNVGGLIGAKGQSMGINMFMDCAFHGTVEATGNNVGGIVGSGYTSASAPNTPCITIQNCYADGSVTGLDYVGGIFGGEPASKQCWANGIGYIQNNYFVGTVNGTKNGGADYVGGVIGYMNSLDRYNVISNNYYVEGCGATKGIGGVGAVDLTTTTRYNRSDDPTGADADKLVKSVTSTSLTDGTLLDALNAGKNSSGNWIQDTSYPIFGNNDHLLYLTVTDHKSTYSGGDAIDMSSAVVTGIYSDGTTKTIDPEDVTVTGFNSDVKNYITVTVTYDNHFVLLELRIKNNADYDGNVASAKELVSGNTYHVNMSAANTENNVKIKIEEAISSLDLNGVNYAVAMDSITPAVAGTADNSTVTDGSFSATVTLSKGTATDIVVITGSITATSYDYSNDLTSAKNAVKGMSYNVPQTLASSVDALKAEIEKKIAALDLNGVDVVVAIDDFTAAVAGTENDKPGNDGSFEATVTLTGGTFSDAVAISGKIKATAFPTNWSEKFVDVVKDSWYYDSVAYALAHELFNGVSDSSFDPSGSMTRAMLVTVLYRIENEPDVSGTNNFSDVEAGEWYTNAVIWAAGQQIISGYGDGIFGTNDRITREQMATILYRYAQLKELDVTKTSSLSEYSDANQISSWALDAMKWCVAEELIYGIDSTTLSPQGYASRAQVATILMRFLEK
jgi:hypothetical protein